MPLYTFPNPARDTIDTLKAAAPTYWPTASVSVSFPTSLTAPHIQVAWDGTPGGEAQRELTSVRVTVWTPKGQPSAAADLASLVEAVLLDGGSEDVWRYTRSTGRTPGVDDATGLPFCTFNLTAETRPSPVA